MNYCPWTQYPFQYFRFQLLLSLASQLVSPDSRLVLASGTSEAGLRYSSSPRDQVLAQSGMPFGIKIQAAKGANGRQKQQKKKIEV